MSGNGELFGNAPSAIRMPISLGALVLIVRNVLLARSTRLLLKRVDTLTHSLT